jgi:hypothetical protein
MLLVDHLNADTVPAMPLDGSFHTRFRLIGLCVTKKTDGFPQSDCSTMFVSVYGPLASPSLSRVLRLPPALSKGISDKDRNAKNWLFARNRDNCTVSIPGNGIAPNNRKTANIARTKPIRNRIDRSVKIIFTFFKNVSIIDNRKHA